MIQVLTRKYFSEWGNGTSFSSNTSDFGTHLKGSIGEKVKAVIRVQAALISIADTANQFEVLNGNVLRRQSGSWIDEGFAVGQSCAFIRDYTGLNTSNAASVEWTDTILAINDTEIQFSSAIGAVGYKSDHALVCASKFPALLYNSAIVPNDGALDVRSPYTNDIQGFYYSTIDTTTPTVHTMKNMSGSKSWKSGGATVEYKSSSNPLGIATNYVHEYEITQEFVISPVFLESYLNALNSGTSPEEFEGDKSVKHVCTFEFRSAMNNPNTTVRLQDEEMLGSVGWINENFNGFENIYSVTLSSYTDTETGDAVNRLQLGKKTKVSGYITGTGLTNTNQLGVYFWWGAPFSVYSSNKDSFQSTFLWDSLLATMSSGTISATGSERIKRVKFDYVDATRVNFEFDIEISSSEQEMINPDLLDVVSDKYFIGVQVGNNNATDTSNKVILQADWNQFVINNDVAGLVDFYNQRFYDHGMDISNGGYSDYKGWKQDGFNYACTLVLNKFLNANLHALKARLIAYNTVSGEEFSLQEYSFDLSNIVEIGTYQKLTLDVEREFRLASGDQFNSIYVNFKDPVGDYQEVELILSMKFDWQSWIKLPGADTIFYNTSLDSNGLGKDASRYEGNNYEIRLAIDADVKQLTEKLTKYVNYSPQLKVYGWDLDGNDPAEWSTLIQTFDIDDNDLGGAILKTGDTKLVITFTPQSGDSSGFTDEWVVHRLDKLLSSGYGIIELSSFRDKAKNSPLKPINGETYTKITNTGTEIITESLIDYTKISGNYNISARLSRTPSYPRYGIARDIKTLSESEVLLFNCPDNGVAVSNSLRLAEIVDGFIDNEVAISLSALYTYQNFKMVVSDVVTNGKPNFYAITYTGSATEVHEFIYNGSTYLQTRIYSANLGGGTYTCIRIDPEMGQVNGKPYFWIGNSQASIGGQRGFKHLYYNGASWTTLDWKCYDSGSPANSQCRYPIDVNFYGGNIYVMNLDLPPNSNQWEQGKIAVYSQTSGSVTTPADRANFANYTNSYNVYRNSGDTENQDGPGNDADLLAAVGFEILTIDDDSNPVFLVVHDVSLGTDGARHISRVYSTVASPNSSDDWTIQTPMIATNLLYGGVEKLNGKAGLGFSSSPLQRKNQCHAFVVGDNEFVLGHIKPYWVKFIINDWSGENNNDWFVFTPNDPTFNFTTGNILK